MLNYSTHQEKIHQLRTGKLLLKENVNYFINKIKEHSHLNAFNFIFEEDSLHQAELVSKKIADGTHGKLAGMVIAVKDVLAIQNKPLTCSSKILSGFNSLFTSTAVKKIIDEDGIIIGKTNCDEFAMGSSNENSAFGIVKNPVNPEYVPGGSSGGSAVAVAAGLCDVSLGTDTGGSIRQPASFCGVYGVKPTYGLVSRYGLTAFASSFDTIGPFANNIEDIAAVLSIISGKDIQDSTSADFEIPDYISLLQSEKKITIGIPKEYFGRGLNEEVKSAIESKIQVLRNNGIEIKDISLPHTEYSIAAYYILTTAEASSNLARYDGARYGYRSSNSSTLNKMYISSRSEGFGTEVKRRIMLGTYVLSAGYYDAYYRKAQKVRRLLKADFDKAFENVDIILTPTSPGTAFRIGEKSNDPLEMYLSDIYTTSANLAGIPGINIPIGKDKKGLPIGMQLMANQFQEGTLLNAAHLISRLK